MMSASTRRALLLTLGAAVMASGGAMAQGPQVAATLPLAGSLPDELSLALGQTQPLVIMVSLEGCVFCRIARQSHLAPYHREGGHIVQVNMRSSQRVRDFDGQTTTHEELVKRWRVSVAPTLLFIGPQGREVAERMEGGYQPDFYGPYLEARLDTARAAIRTAQRRH